MEDDPPTSGCVLVCLHACDACHKSKRKCNGVASGCAWCLLKGVHCTYSPHKPPGPRPKFKAPALVGIRTDASRRGSRSSMTGFVAWPTPVRPLGPGEFVAGPLVPELSRSCVAYVIGHANRMLKTCDKARVLSSLGLGAGPAAEPTVLVDASGDLPPGLRACAFMLLCMSSKLQGDTASAVTYYGRAQDCIDAALSQLPTQHFVSALLLLSLMALPIGRDQSDAISFSAMAQGLASCIPGLDSEIFFTASCYRSKNLALAFNAVSWPASRPSIGMLLQHGMFSSLQSVQGYYSSVWRRSTSARARNEYPVLCCAPVHAWVC